MKAMQIAGIAALASVLTACADSTISQPEKRTPPTTGAAFNGIGLGSGGGAPADSSNTSAGGTTGTATTSSTCGTDDELNGGIGLGSGGRIEECPIDPQ
jgi:hypothetical protein